MPRLRIGVIGFLLTCGLSATSFAQTINPPVEPEPQYSAAFGLGFNHYEGPQVKGWAAFESRIAAGTFSISTLNLTSKAANLSTGLRRNFYNSGPVTMFGLADIGLATGEGATAATFGGGGGLKLSLAGAAAKVSILKAFSGVPGSYVIGAVRVQQLNGQGVSPTFTFGLGVDFR